MAGAKTVELRKRFRAKANQFALLYSTLPVAAVVGSVRIIDVDQLPVPDIWRLHGRDAAVTSTEFSDYFSGTASGCALHLADPRPYRRPISLAELRSEHGLEAPQSYVLLNDAHRSLIRHEHE
jgi:predicted transcriptional regulator